MKYPQFTVRGVIFCAGAVGAVAEAIDIAQRADIQVTPAHLIALGCTALAMYTLKYHRDVTADEAKEIEARARRESILPPLSQETRDLVDLVRNNRVAGEERDE
jgi:hypothetical protein